MRQLRGLTTAAQKNGGPARATQKVFFFYLFDFLLANILVQWTYNIQSEYGGQF